MASKTQDEMLRRFNDVSWRQGAGSSGSRVDGPRMEGAAQEGIFAASAATASATPAGQNVPGGAKTEIQNDGGGGTAATVIKDVFESGLGVVPLIGGLLGLFGGGSDSPPPVTKYQMPSSVSFMSAETSEGLTAADFSQTGLPREYGGPDDGLSGGVGRAQDSNGASSAGQQITVNVQAMDAQSFLDRSGDIAQAVRSAMLNMSSINDVVNEL